MIIQHPKSADKELLRWSIDSLYVCHIQLFRRFFSFGLLDRPLYHQPFLVVQLQWEPFYYSIITRGEHILWHEYYFCYFLLPSFPRGTVYYKPIFIWFHKVCTCTFREKIILKVGEQCRLNVRIMENIK